MEELTEFLLKSKEWFEHLVETIRQYAGKLEESEKWLSTTPSSIGDAVIATDKLGNAQFVNPVAEALTGYKQKKRITIEKGYLSILPKKIKKNGKILLNFIKSLHYPN